MSLSERLPFVDKIGARLSEIRSRVESRVTEKLADGEGAKPQTPDVLEDLVYRAIAEVISEQNLPLTTFERAGLAQEVVDGILGGGPVEALLRDAEVTEIMVVRFDQIFVERHGRIHQVSAKFDTEEQLRRVIDRLVQGVGRRIDESSPMVDARLADGSRLNAVIPPVAIDGSNLTIRKFSREVLTGEQLVNSGTFTADASAYLAAAVAGRMNIVISGGTGSGKTTTLNVLAGFIPDNQRIVTIEDSAELQLNREHVIRLEARPQNSEGVGEVTIRQLVRNALRMRPDRIVVGEVRDGAALDMLQAMNTGHDGSLTTVHANSATDALARLETMTLMAGMELPLPAIRAQIASAVNLVVHQARLPDGSRRVTSIVEVLGVSDGILETRDVFRAEYLSDGGFALVAAGLAASPELGV
jgi:pilus assembly protein CpaF